MKGRACTHAFLLLVLLLLFCRRHDASSANAKVKERRKPEQIEQGLAWGKKRKGKEMKWNENMVLTCIHHIIYLVEKCFEMFTFYIVIAELFLHRAAQLLRVTLSSRHQRRWTVLSYPRKEKTGAAWLTSWLAPAPKSPLQAVSKTGPMIGMPDPGESGNGLATFPTKPSTEFCKPPNAAGSKIGNKEG